MRQKGFFPLLLKEKAGFSYYFHNPMQAAVHYAVYLCFTRCLCSSAAIHQVSPHKGTMSLVLSSA